MKGGYPVAGDVRCESIPMVTRLAPVDTVDAEARTVTLAWTTGADVLRYDYWEGQRYIERLQVDDASCHLDRLNAGAPLLNSHQMQDLSCQVGVVEKAWIDGGVGYAQVRFPKAGIDTDADRVFQLVQDKIVRNVSVGYIANRYEVTDNQGNGLDIWTAVDWTPSEISLVTIPADTGAGTRSLDDPKVNQPTYACEFVMRAAPAQPKETIMSKSVTEPGAASGADPVVIAESAVRIAPVQLETQPTALAASDAAASAVLAERQRIMEINQRTVAAGLPQDVADGLIQRGVAAEHVGNLLLDEMAKRGVQPAFSAAHTPAGGLDATETRRSAISEALLNRAFPENKACEITDRAREWRGFSLRELAREFLSSSGISVRGASPIDIAQRALGTSDFPLILANVVNKSLQIGYATEVRTFLPFCTQRNATDFKTMYSMQLGEGSNLSKVSESGEYSYATFGEGQETWKLTKYGKIFPITYETIINDDMGVFTRLPFMFGQSAVRNENDIVWGFLIDNANMNDGKALFSTDHSNLLTGVDTAMSLTGLSDMRKSFRQQKGLDNKKTLNLLMKYVMVGSANETALEQILTPAIYAAQAGNVVPQYYRSLTPIVEARIDAVSDTAWFGAADPSQQATIEYGYLEGQQGIYMETRNGFERDGVEFKVRHVFGGAPVNHRGLAKATGVAK